MGNTINAIDKNDFATCKDVYFDDESWTIRYLVVDTGSWLAERQVLVSPKSFGQNVFAKTGNPMTLSLTCRQIEEGPEINEHEPVSRQQEAKLAEYYLWPAYWTIPHHRVDYLYGGLAGAVSEEARLQAAEAAKDTDDRSSQAESHLRSVSEVKGYRVQSFEESVGHIEDFIVNQENLKIWGVVIDTRNWLPGKKVVVPRYMIDSVSWSDSAVNFFITKQEIEDSPAVDMSQPISEVALSKAESRFTAVH